MAFLKLSLILSLFFSLICCDSQHFHYVTLNKTIQSKPLVNGKPELKSDVVAWAIFSNDVNKTGWANLEVSTNPLFSDEDQAVFAGYLEGFLTADLIGMNWRNSLGNYCSGDINFCKKLKNFLKINQNFIEQKIIENSASDPFWYQIKLIYKQVEGLQEGYDDWEKKTNYVQPKEFDPVNLMMLNLNSELSGIKEIIQESNSSRREKMHCSAIVKVLPDGSDLFVAHNTWSDFSSMLRVMKKYDFKFRRLPKHSQMIPGHSTAFSSYPGLTISEDDYYILSSGLVVQETTNEVFNKSLYKSVHPDKIVFEFIRNLVANRLALSGEEWARLFSNLNSGTYNNQFMVVDYKKFKPGTRPNDLPDNLLWVVEQMPGLMQSRDVTDVVRKTSCWASYNIAYFKDIFNISGANTMVKKFGNYYTYDKTARAMMFKRDHAKVTDLKSLYQLMRYNDFKNDALSRCAVYNQTCAPTGFSADLAIAARNDLNDPRVRYPLIEWSHRGEGAIDAKITNYTLVKKLQMLAVSGPTYEQQPPFKWSNTTVTGLRHEGHPDLFNFKPILVKWAPEKSRVSHQFDN